MKRIVMGIVAAAFLLAATPAWSNNLKPLPTPNCVVTGASFNPATRRVTGIGNCVYKLITTTASGKKVVRTIYPLGRKWSFVGLSSFDQNGSACASTKTSGVGNTFVVQPKGAYKASVTFKLRVLKNRYHKASKVASKTVTLKPGATNALCSGSPTIATIPPDSPTLVPGAVCSWAGSTTPIIDAGGVRVPNIGCLVGQTCQWRPLGGTYTKYGMTVYPGIVDCRDGSAVTPVIRLTFTYSDGTSCMASLSGVLLFPLPLAGFTGSMRVVIHLAASGPDGGPLPSGLLPDAFVGPIAGTGTVRVC